MKIIRHLQRWKACWVFLAIAFPVFGDPLDNWTIIPSGTTNYLGAVTFGDGVFVLLEITDDSDKFKWG